MDRNESVRKFEQLMFNRADQAHEAAIELEARVSLLPSEKSRQLVRLQVKATHKQAKELQQAKELRELAQKVKENYSHACWLLRQSPLDRRALQLQPAEQLSVRSYDDGREAHCDCTDAHREVEAPVDEKTTSDRDGD